MASKAFSLIELMVVVAVVGILSAVAIPAYKNYVVKAKIIEAVQVMSGYKNNIIFYYDTNGRLPAASDISPGAPSAHFMDNVWDYYNADLASQLKLRNLWYGSNDGLSEFYMDAYYSASAFDSPEVDGRILKMYGKLVNGTWMVECGSSDDLNGIPARLLPAGCNTVPVDLND